MAAPSNPHRWKYDVFVSFRGEDIRKNFMDHLFNDFTQKGIHAFRDNNELPKGEEIPPHLYKAIEESRFLIVIFSKNYASSTWCLRELVKILGCKEMGWPKHEVQIIFYDVKPDVVRKQTDSYAEAFSKHQVYNTTDVDKWKDALFMAANLSGWDLEDMTNGYEYKFIDCISKDILIKLCDGPLHVGENLVGLDFHFDKLDWSRFVGSHKVNMLGICGISGIGKTTRAKAIYNLMYVHFEGSCFCEDVKEVTTQQGLIQAQLHMIGKIMKIEDLKISSVGEGIMVIKKMVSSKPILLVLDNVDDHEQLEALASSPDWFFRGSLVIFTSKYKQLLRSHKVDELYEMESLNDYKALELFSLYAFGKRHPTEDFEEFASQIVKYLQGHPLALKVFGRLLYDKSVYVGKSELDRLQTYPNSEIVQKLRPSFDSLASDQKRMFLDIASAFIGEKKYFAASVLDSCHCSANAIIEVLVDKFLITLSADCLQMHELIKSMSREIIHEELRHNHRRLWISSEDYDVLNVNKVTEEVEVLVLLLKKNCQNIPIDGQALTRMKNLRILKICFPEVERRWQQFTVNISGRLDLLSNKLRLLHWHGFPLKFLPSVFYPENIVTIDLSYSHIKHLWTTPKCFMRLKFMKLRYCCYLTSIPDFSKITNLEELNLEGCENLVKVHPSIGMLKKLVVLNMRNCKRLKSFPSKLEMVSLQILILSGCLKMEKLPEDLGKIKSLTKLHIDRTSITELPLLDRQESFRSRRWTSIRGPFSLQSKQQHPQRSISMEGFHMLKSLNFSYCNLVHVPVSIGGLSCLQKLNLAGNNLLEVPESIGGLSHLQILNLAGNNLLEVPESIGGLSGLKYLYLSENNLLEVSDGIGGLSCLEYLDLNGNNLLEVPESIGGLSCLECLYLGGNNFTSLPGSLGQLSQLRTLNLDNCKKLEVFPELPPRVYNISACHCTSLCSITGSSKDPIMINTSSFLSNCPKLFTNVAIESQVSISETQCVGASITSQGSTNKIFSFLRDACIQNNRCEFFRFPESVVERMDIIYRGNSIPKWFTNKSMGNNIKIELPSDWCLDKFRGFGTCVVFKLKNTTRQYLECSIKNFDGASLGGWYVHSIGSNESYRTWLLYTRDKEVLKRAKNFVTFCFGETYDFNERCYYEDKDIEVKECGVRLIWDEGYEGIWNLSMLQDLPTLSQPGGAIGLSGRIGHIDWSW